MNEIQTAQISITVCRSRRLHAVKLRNGIVKTELGAFELRENNCRIEKKREETEIGKNGQE